MKERKKMGDGKGRGRRDTVASRTRHSSREPGTLDWRRCFGRPNLRYSLFIATGVSLPPGCLGER